MCGTYRFTVARYKTDGRAISSTMAPNTLFSFSVNSKLAMCITYTHTFIVITSVSNSSCPFRSEFCPKTLFTACKSSYAHRLTVVSYRTQSQTIPAQLVVTFKERKAHCHSLAGIHQRHRPRPDLPMREQRFITRSKHYPILIQCHHVMAHAHFSSLYILL